MKIGHDEILPLILPLVYLYPSSQLTSKHQPPKKKDIDLHRLSFQEVSDGSEGWSPWESGRFGWPGHLADAQVARGGDPSTEKDAPWLLSWSLLWFLMQKKRFESGWRLFEGVPFGCQRVAEELPWDEQRKEALKAWAMNWFRKGWKALFLVFLVYLIHSNTPYTLNHNERGPPEV